MAEKRIIPRVLCPSSNYKIYKHNKIVILYQKTRKIKHSVLFKLHHVDYQIEKGKNNDPYYFVLLIYVNF
jgi:hypothetical protein